MALSFPVVWSDAQRLHAPETGVWLGVAIAADEVPARADCIRGVLEEAGASVVAAEAHDDETLLAVHDAGLIEFLRSAWSEWQAEGYRDDPGQADVVCYIFPTAGLLSGLEPRCARGASRVGLLDVDAHHGNGAQAIFRERDDVLTASVHVDPAEGWFPHFLGFPDESGQSNLNVTLPSPSASTPEPTTRTRHSP